MSGRRNAESDAHRNRSSWLVPALLFVTAAALLALSIGLGVGLANEETKRN